MAELDTLQETKQREDAGTGRADLLVAIPAPLGSEALSSTVTKLTEACALLPSPYQVMLALPGEPAQISAAANEEAAGAAPLQVVNYPPPQISPGAIAWLPSAVTYRDISVLAGKVGARACTILGADLGFNRDSLNPERLTLLLDPAIEGGFDLVMPLYSTPPFDDLVNKSILYPLTCTLYGYRVRNPLGSEFQMSSKLYSSMAAAAYADSTRLQGRLPWPATMASSKNFKICQARLGSRQPSSADGIELSDALAQLIGPLFLDMEDNAAFWQRIRGSHEVPTFGALDSSTDAPGSVDVRHMLDAFQLGVRNLREIWSLILPPLTLLELKKLSNQTADDFHMEDALWARIIYDFALAHRLRNIRRAHLFGALTPLYLGWVASYAVEINRRGIASAQDRVEQIARIYESEKPYLLSRWRWPDRFHP